MLSVGRFYFRSHIQRWFCIRNLSTNLQAFSVHRTLTTCQPLVDYGLIWCQVCWNIIYVMHSFPCYLRKTVVMCHFRTTTTSFDNRHRNLFANGLHPTENPSVENFLEYQ